MPEINPLMGAELAQMQRSPAAADAPAAAGPRAALAPPPAAAAPASPSPRLAQLQSAHEAAQAQLTQIQSAKTMLDQVKSELQILSRLGDMVTPEDVIEGAGKLVAQGAPAGQMAALLSSMPQGSGAVLQGWLAQQEAQVAQREAQIVPAHGILGHRAAVAAMQVLAGADAESAGSNALGVPQAASGEASNTPQVQSGASALDIRQG